MEQKPKTSDVVAGGCVFLVTAYLNVIVVRSFIRAFKKK